MKKIIKNNFLLIFIVLFASAIFFTNLSGQDYSLDEPETLVVAKSILKFGFPSAWDGKNLISVNNGSDFKQIGSKYFWTWHPWVQHYLAAAGLLFFGDSLTGLRIPFVFLALLTVITLYFISQELFEKKLTSFLLSLHLVFLLPFFLYIRQARYYSAGVFFSLIILWLLIKHFKNRWDKNSTLLFLVSSLLLFMTNYLIWISTMIVLIIIMFFKKRMEIIKVVIVEVIFVILWFLIFKPYNGNIFFNYSGLTVLIGNFFKYFSYINNFIFPFLLIPFLIFTKDKRLNFFALLILWISVKIIFDSIFLVPHGRYLVDLFPIFILLYGYIYNYFFNKKLKIVSFVIFALVITTNILYSIPARIISPARVKFSFWPTAYAIELTGKYKSMMPQLSTYLKDKYNDGDLFWSNEYRWYIYKYSDVPHVSPICNSITNKFLGPPSVIDPEKIRWFIFFQHDDRLTKNLENVPCLGKNWQERLIKDYHKRIFRLSSSVFIINDPDIINRQFPPVKAKEDQIIIYEK